MRLNTVLLILAVLAVAVASFAEDEAGRLTRVVEVVSGTDQTPVVGAVVEAWGLPRGPSRKRTGEDGIVRFEEMPRKGVVYVARRPGSRCAWHEPGRWWWTQPEEDADPDGDGVTRMTLVLGPGSVVRGTVRAKSGGAPIAGVMVEAREVAHATDLWTLEGAPIWTATTDAEGRFETTEHWPPVPEGEKRAASGRLVSAIVVAHAAGWISEQIEVWPDDAGSQDPLSFELHPAIEIRGTVTRTDGEPAGGAVVHAYPVDFWAFSPGRSSTRDTRRTHPREMRVRADADGRYAFREALPGAHYRVFAEAEVDDPDFHRKRVVARSRVSAAEVGGDTTLDLRLLELGSLRVRVAPEAGGSARSRGIDFTPPEGARPWVYDHEQDDGSVLVREADPGRWRVEVRAGGWADQVADVDVEEGEESTLVVRLTRGASVEGVLVDDDGEPVGDTALYAYGIDPANPERWLDGHEEARSDADGRFTFKGLRPGPTAISASHESLRADGYTRVDAPAKDVRIVLRRPVAVRFWLGTPDGEEAPSRVRVTVTRRAGGNRGTQWQDSVRASKGVFEIEDQLPGPVSFAVEARGYAPFVVRLEIQPSVTNVLGSLALSRGVTLRGRVVDAVGEPIAGARVLAWGNVENAAETTPDGTFEIPHLGPGGVELTCSAPGMARRFLTAPVSADADPLQVVLTPGGRVRGSFLDAGGRNDVVSIDIFPAASAHDNVSRWRTGVVDGAFSIALPPGRYRCSFRRADAEHGPTVFDVVEGGEVVLELAFR